MTGTAPPGDVPGQAHRQNVQPTTMSGWVGWIAFAGVMMLMLGMLHVIEGLMALFREEYYVVGNKGLTVHVDWTTWGWFHLIGGILVMLAGIGLFTGKLWARMVGVFLAVMSAVVSIGFMAAYPFWGVIMVAIAVLVIWALVVHGDELKQ